MSWRYIILFEFIQLLRSSFFLNSLVFNEIVDFEASLIQSQQQQTQIAMVDSNSAQNNRQDKVLVILTLHGSNWFNQDQMISFLLIELIELIEFHEISWGPRICLWAYADLCTRVIIWHTFMHCGVSVRLEISQPPENTPRGFLPSCALNPIKAVGVCLDQHRRTHKDDTHKYTDI